MPATTDRFRGDERVRRYSMVGLSRRDDLKLPEDLAHRVRAHCADVRRCNGWPNI